MPRLFSIPPTARPSTTHLNAQRIATFSMVVAWWLVNPEKQIPAEVAQLCANIYATFCQTTNKHEKAVNIIEAMLTAMILVGLSYMLLANEVCAEEDGKKEFFCRLMLTVFFWRNGLNFFNWTTGEILDQWPHTPVQNHAVPGNPAPVP